MLELKGDKRTLDRMIAKAQALATGRLSKTLAPRIAGGELGRLARTAKASQVSPAGKPWPRTKNGRPVSWPSQATLKITITGGKVVATVSGPDYLAPQHSGWRRFTMQAPRARGADGKRVQASGPARAKRWGGKARRILPKSAIPKRWATPILAAINAGWRGFMGSTSVARAKK